MWQKKLLLWTGVSFFAAALGLTTVASAQVNLPVQAEVLEAITVTNPTSLNFGSFVPTLAGGDIVVSPDSGIATTTTGPVLFGNDTRGTIDLTANQAELVLVTVTKVSDPADLVSGATMTLGSLTCGSDNSAASFGAAPCSFNMPGILGGGTILTKVGIGGTLTVAPNQTAGTYTGVVAVTAAYN